MTIESVFPYKTQLPKDVCNWRVRYGNVSVYRCCSDSHMCKFLKFYRNAWSSFRKKETAFCTWCRNSKYEKLSGVYSKRLVLQHLLVDNSDDVEKHVEEV